MGLDLFGARAVESMRMEKGYLHWKSDLITEFDPYETGLDRFVKIGKGGFVGKAALEARVADGPRRKLVTLCINSNTSPAHPGASVVKGDVVVGTVTSGEWGHRVGQNLAYAFVDAKEAAIGAELTVDMAGEASSASIIDPSPYDPSGSLCRS